MPQTLITFNNFSHIVRSLHRDILSGNDTYYTFLGRSYEWPDEPVPLDIHDTRIETSLVKRDIIAAKRVKPTDICLLVRRIDWESGTVYDRYDDDIVMEGLDFYAMNTSFRVYKCINNAGGSPSTVMPTHDTLEPAEEADGYIWQYLYTVSEADQIKFLTDDFIPVRFYSTVNRFDHNGIVDSIEIEDFGTGYTEAPIVSITGDGSGAVATANISFGGVTSIDVVSAGVGYTFAHVNLISNVGSGARARAVLGRTDETDDNSLVATYAQATDGTIRVVDVISGGQDYDAGDTFASVAGDGSGAVLELVIDDGEITGVNILDGGVGYTYAEIVLDTNSGSGAHLRVAVGPQGGSGSNLPEELKTSALAVFVDISDEEEFSEVEVYRQHGLIKNIRDSAGNLITADTVGIDGINSNTGTLLFVRNTEPLAREPGQTDSIRIILHNPKQE